MKLELPALGLETFLERFSDGGGVVEERIVASAIRSPSVQLRVTPTGEVDLLSTHDLLLLCIGTNSTIHDEKRMKMASDSLYLKSLEAMLASCVAGRSR